MSDIGRCRPSKETFAGNGVADLKVADRSSLQRDGICRCQCSCISPVPIMQFAERLRMDKRRSHRTTGFPVSENSQFIDDDLRLGR